MMTEHGDEELKGLLDAFGDAFSLEDIASAYSQAGKDTHLAAELLYKSDGEGYSSSFASCGSSSETKSVDSLDGSFVIVNGTNGNMNESSPVNGNRERTNQIWRPVSTGTVSGQLGKEYVSSKPLENKPPCLSKTSKVGSRSQSLPTSYGYESASGNRKDKYRKRPLMGRISGHDYVSSKPFENGHPCMTKTSQVEFWSQPLPTSYCYEPTSGKNKPLMRRISGHIGNDKPFEYGPPGLTTTSRVESQPLPKSYGYDYETPLGYKKEEFGKKEMEDFLFDLLGIGFKLDKSQIRTVLGQCGYDIQKSMRELLNISAENSAKCCRNVRKPSRDYVYTQRRCSGRSRNSRDEEVAVNNNDTELSDAFRSKIDREIEVLAALFIPAEKTTELSKRSGVVKDLGISNAATEVAESAEGSSDDLKAESTGSQKNDDVDADLEADNFQVLRRAVKDYVAAKKEYYRAAVEAHAKGDHAQAAKFLEQGEFFHQKARQADDESVQKIFEIGPNANKPDDTFTVDLHECSPKEAIRLLKCHLSMLSAFSYCTLIISTDDKDATKGPRKRKIMKLLKEQSIHWIQGSEAGTILISTDISELETL